MQRLSGTQDWSLELILLADFQKFTLYLWLYDYMYLIVHIFFLKEISPFWLMLSKSFHLANWLLDSWSLQDTASTLMLSRCHLTELRIGRGVNRYCNGIVCLCIAMWTYINCIYDIYYYGIRCPTIAAYFFRTSSWSMVCSYCIFFTLSWVEILIHSRSVTRPFLLL